MNFIHNTCLPIARPSISQWKAHPAQTGEREPDQTASCRVVSFRITILCISALALITMHTHAGDADDDVDRTGHPVTNVPSTVLEPLTVTSEKRKSLAARTPIAMTVFSATELEDAGILDIPSLSLRTPGLWIGNNSNTSTPELFIRGIGTTNLSTGSDISIGFYVDDIYIGRGEGMFMNLFDIERIEVLRGPQGTLYGRNTIGGALNIHTKKPTSELTSTQRLQLGSYDLVSYRGQISGPLAKDKVLGRLSYSFTDREGYTENVFDGERLADVDNVSGRASLWFDLGGDADLMLNLDASRDRATAIAYKPIIIPGGIASFLGHVEPSGAFKVNHDTSGNEDRDIFGVSGKFTVDMNTLTFVSISSFRTLNFDLLDDVDGTSLQLGNLDRELEQKQFSQEFRLLSKDEDTVSWILGVFAFSETSDDVTKTFFQDYNFLIPPFTPGTYDFSATNISETKVRSYAIYGQGKYSLTDQLSAVIGLRYSYEEKKFKIFRDNNDLGIVTAALADIPETTMRDDWDAFTPRFGLEFSPNKNVMYYGSVSRGFKSGGFNSFQTKLEGSFDPEYLTAYQVGAKTQWFDRRLQLDAGAFYYDHKDLQVQTLVGTSLITTNAARANSYGLEVELRGRPTDELEVNGGIALLETEFDKYVNASGTKVDGNSMSRSPSLSTNYALQYSQPLPDDGKLTIRGEHQYQSKIFFTETNEDILSQAGYHIFNARLAYESPNGRFSLALYGKNLTDEESVQGAYDLRADFGTVIQSYSPPRTLGLELTVIF